ncbi:hypothetical protein GCM10010468_53580 [Actinocorallia longicatena]|uniref:Uncharacterized protein n=1 Tax=Actinocorallia longicatena TaxID=111803 RepID=A0ABP6QH32_9ACTN
MADGDVSAQGAEHGLVEDLGDEAHVLEDHDPRSIGHRDSGRFLAAVLECVETVIGEFGYFGGRGGVWGDPDTEDATGVLRAFVGGIELVAQASIGVGRHGVQFRGCEQMVFKRPLPWERA